MCYAFPQLISGPTYLAPSLKWHPPPQAIVSMPWASGITGQERTSVHYSKTSSQSTPATRDPKNKAYLHSYAKPPNQTEHIPTPLDTSPKSNSHIPAPHLQQPSWPRPLPSPGAPIVWSTTSFTWLP